MAINFPDSPSINDTHTVGSQTWVWGGVKWSLKPSFIAKGGGNDAVFFENDQTIASNYTILSGKNALSAGPITISNGVTITISNGSSWSVI